MEPNWSPKGSKNHREREKEHAKRRHEKQYEHLLSREPITRQMPAWGGACARRTEFLKRCANVANTTLTASHKDVARRILAPESLAPQDRTSFSTTFLRKRALASTDLEQIGFYEEMYGIKRRRTTQ